MHQQPIGAHMVDMLAVDLKVVDVAQLRTPRDTNHTYSAAVRSQKSVTGLELANRQEELPILAPDTNGT